MSRKLDELLNKYAWNSLQIQQLRLADKKKLDLTYFHPQYDWEQLREIRLALEDGLDPSFLLDRHINSDSMHKTRETIYKMSGLFDKNIEIAKIKKLKRMTITTLLLLFILTFIIVCTWKKDYILQMVSGLELELIDTNYEIGLSKIESFRFSDLIKKYSKDAELILPDTHLETVGEYNLTYVIKNQAKSLTKTIVVSVVDDINPTLTLKQNTVSITYGSSFSAKDYIEEATDNIDGNLINQVKITSAVDTTKPKKYTVTYSLTDSSHNNTISELTVVVKEKEENTQTEQKNNSTNASKSNESSSKHQSSSNDTAATNKVSASNKTFLFVDYGDATKTEEAALSYAKNALNSKMANGYKCNPIKENGIYIGYEVIFN